MVRRRGLPKDHSLDVDVDSVVADIPDALDMELEPRRPAKLKLEVVPERGRAPDPAREPERVRERPRGAGSTLAPPPAKPRQREEVSAAKARVRPPRKEIGFDDETLGMLKELHDDGRSQSVEESLTRSECGCAAVRAIHAARDRIRYSSIRLRGRHGSATARALKQELTDCYFRAIGEEYVEQNYREIRARIEEDIRREQEGG